jgi:hypothetical protein
MFVSELNGPDARSTSYVEHVLHVFGNGRSI